jgi:hypothetical protein
MSGRGSDPFSENAMLIPIKRMFRISDSHKSFWDIFTFLHPPSTIRTQKYEDRSHAIHLRVTVVVAVVAVVLFMYLEPAAMFRRQDRRCTLASNLLRTVWF